MKYANRNLTADFSVATENPRVREHAEKITRSFFDLLETITMPLNGTIEILLLETLRENLTSAALEMNSIVEKEMVRIAKESAEHVPPPTLN
ncbi:MAG: hypothetical protein HYT22_00670 [Candidatus Niyogibacteria bacterium]|nr:hypothetical protein [Candidatus Niyogibacteria bacterium]